MRSTRRGSAARFLQAHAPVSSAQPSWEVDLLPETRSAEPETLKSSGKDGILLPMCPAEAAPLTTGTAVASESSRSATALRRKALALLNKLSCRNEAVLVSQLLAMEPSTSQELLVVADLLYDQAMKDTPNVRLYFRAALAMNQAFPTFEVDEGTCMEDARSTRPSTLPRQALSLVGRLLQRCQADFARIRSYQDESGGSSARSTNAATTWSKEQSLSSLRLLGELYHCGWASPRILAQVLFELLRSCPGRRALPGSKADLPCEPYVECACELVCIMVASEGIKDKQAWNLIWGRLAWLKDAKRLPHEPGYVYSQRLRFKLLDAVEAVQRAVHPSSMHLGSSLN